MTKPQPQALLELKGEFKNISGKDWKPGMTVVEEVPAVATPVLAAATPAPGGAAGEAIKAQAEAQGTFYACGYSCAEAQGTFYACCYS